eukprot:Rhum_TRINITY_DN25736_c0_g1::Rhum_TRINITY_DN25736_c0_g1_i1::g.182619::m.182619
MGSKGVEITRLGLPGGRQSSVSLCVGSAGAIRVRAGIAEALVGCETVAVPLMHGKNVVCATMPVEGDASTDGACSRVVKVAAQCADVEVCDGGAEPCIYKVGVDAGTRLHRLLLTEFLLKDSNAGHPAASFTS